MFTSTVKADVYSEIDGSPFGVLFITVEAFLDKGLDVEFKGNKGVI
jgi:hypothetical protein